MQTREMCYTSHLFFLFFVVLAVPVKYILARWLLISNLFQLVSFALIATVQLIIILYNMSIKCMLTLKGANSLHFVYANFFSVFEKPFINLNYIL